MSQPYCSRCLTVTTPEMETCAACGKARRANEGWPVSTTFRYPWLGYLVDQRYRLVQYLGYGGMGDVYRAESLSVGVSLAAKLSDRRIVPASRTSEDLAERLDREVAAMARLYSPHVTRVIDYYLLPEDIFLLLIEYAPGRTLDSIVEESGPLAPELATDIVRQVLEALAELAEFNLVHRDLKPENIMVQTLPSGRPFVRLLDFGIVKVVARARITEGFVGTPHFAAPEQALDSGRVDLRSDLYSLGCIYFYMLTGRVPFPGDSPVGVLNMHLHSPIPEVQDYLPEAYDRPEVFDMVRRLLAKDPDDRPKSAAHVLRMPPFDRAASSVLAARPARVQSGSVSLPPRSELLSNPDPAEHREERVVSLSEWLDSPVALLAVSPDETMAAAVTRDHELIVWPFDDPSAARRIALSRSGVIGWLFFDGEGVRIVVATRAGILTTYRVDTLEVVQKLKLPPSMYKWIGPSRLHSDLVMAVTPGSMFRWRIGGGLLKLMEGEFLREVAFVGAVGKDETVLFERGTGRRLRLKEVAADPRRIEVAWMSSHAGLDQSEVLDLAPSGQMLLAGRELLLEANHWHERMAPVDAPAGYEWALSVILGDGNPLVLSRDGHLYSLPIGREPVYLGESIAGLASGLERKRVVLCDAEGGVSHFAVGSGELVPAMQAASRPRQRVWGLTPDLDRVATRLAEPENTLEIRRISPLGVGDGGATGDERRALLIPPIRALRWAEDSGTAYALSEERFPMLLDLEAGEGLLVDLLPYVPVAGCTAGAGRLLCVADRTGVVECLNPTNGLTLWRLKCESPATALAASARTGTVAIGFLDGSLQLVHTSSGETRAHVAQAHAFAVEHLRFRPDGEELASLASDGGVQVRRVDGEIVRSATFPAGPDAIGVILDRRGVPWIVRADGDDLIATSIDAPDAPQLLGIAPN
jgi:serine/threonine protein kinase